MSSFLCPVAVVEKSPENEQDLSCYRKRWACSFAKKIIDITYLPSKLYFPTKNIKIGVSTDIIVVFRRARPGLVSRKSFFT